MLTIDRKKRCCLNAAVLFVTFRQIWMAWLATISCASLSQLCLYYISQKLWFIGFPCYLKCYSSAWVWFVRQSPTKSKMQLWYLYSPALFIFFSLSHNSQHAYSFIITKDYSLLFFFFCSYFLMRKEILL